MDELGSSCFGNDLLFWFSPTNRTRFFSPNDRCGSTTTRLRRFRLPPSSRECTLVCFIGSTEGKYKRAGWYLRAHLLGRYPHGGAPASRRKGGQDRRNDEVRTRASFCLLPSLVTEENAPWAPEDFGRGKTPDWSGTRVTCNSRFTTQLHSKRRWGGGRHPWPQGGSTVVDCGTVVPYSLGA